jgi:DNA-binding response OmpR family regulator
MMGKALDSRRGALKVALVYVISTETLSLITRALSKDYQIMECLSRADAQDCLQRHPVDVVIIDLGIDCNEDGFAFCGDLRKEARWDSLPVIFLSSVRDTRVTVRAFEVGGDDLVHVPFAPEELSVRIEAKFKRLRMQPVVHDLFWKADLRFSLGTQRVVCTDAGGERDLELTPNEFKILYFLARHEETILNRQAILHEVWGENLHVIERTIDKHICSLRRKLGDRAHYVASVPGSGYVFSPTGRFLQEVSLKAEDGTGLQPELIVDCRQMP